MANARTKAKIEARIRERVAYCLEFEVNDPRSSFITITGCEVSNDLSVAKVRYSVMGTPGERSKVAHMLEDATGFIRKQVGRVLKTRRIPRLTWFYDDSVEYQEEVESKIEAALRRDREVNPSAHSDMELRPKTADAEAEVEREYVEFLTEQEEEEERS